MEAVNPFLKAACEACGGHIEHPAEMAGQTVVCPHCQSPVVIPNLIRLLPPLIPPCAKLIYTQGRSGARRIVRVITVLMVVSSVPGGLLGLYLESGGMITISIFGGIIGLILGVAADDIGCFYRCSSCGNAVASKHARLCPVCQSRFVK